MKTRKFILPEHRMPSAWYNIVADMPRKPLPPLHPATRQPLTHADLSVLIAEELAAQELDRKSVV